jgi:CspA family cold shock protein
VFQICSVQLSPIGGVLDDANSDRRAGNDCRCSANASLGSKMAIGTVKFFNTNKGFGFIQPDNGGPDVFVHVTALERAGMKSLAEGQKVSYDVVTERGKSAAANLASA